MTHLGTTTLGGGIAALLVLGLAACAPGGSGPAASQSLAPVTTSVGTDKVTLTVWDQNTEGGIKTAQEQLNAAFTKAHPSVTIARVSRSFSDLKTTLKLALSGDNPPDVVQANQGYPDMGAFVKAGFLRPMNDYAAAYKWNSFYPSSLLKLNSFSADGTTWQGDTLYGVSQTGELVGVYSNSAVLAKAGVTAQPTTLDELGADLAKVKAAGILPLSFGNLNKNPGIHLYGVVLSALEGAKGVDDLVAGRAGAWTDPAPLKAAQTVKDWQDKGYLTPGGNGIAEDNAVAAFGKGGAAFLVTGTWQQATLQAAPAGKDIRLTALTPSGASTPVTTGGEGLAWAITSKARHPDAAAAYVDFVTNHAASEVLATTGNLPTVVPSDVSPASGTLGGDIVATYRTVSAANSLTPYLDYATPTFYDTITAATQDLIGGHASPQQFTDKLQADYAAFAKTKG